MTQNYISPENLRKSLAAQAESVNSVLRQMLDRQAGIQPDLKKAMIYTLDAPGKRIRAAVTMWTCQVVSGRVSDAAKIAAAAIEMVHTYSLVHDDLPSMDDDDMRRGKPTCHKAFNESTAILTGDALLTLAFEVLTGIDDSSQSVRLITELSRAAGGAGMIAGQIADIAGENAEPDIENLEYIHINKTAKMFEASAVMGAIAAAAEPEQTEALRLYGRKIGLGFQVSDDILDVSAESAHLGKTAGKDAEQGKMTYPSLVGLEKSEKIAQKLANQAIDALAIFDEKADILRQLAIELLSRTK